MLNITFNIQNQIITRTDGLDVVADSINYLAASFTFSSEWDGLTKIAVFRYEMGAPYNVILQNDACTVPHEVLKASAFSVSVFAENRITANTVLVNVIKSGYVEGQTPPEPTPDIYSQILDIMAAHTNPPKIVDGIWWVYDKELKQYIDSGVKALGTQGIQGTQGVQGDKGERGDVYFPNIYIDDDMCLIMEDSFPEVTGITLSIVDGNLIMEVSA